MSNKKRFFYLLFLFTIHSSFYSFGQNDTTSIRNNALKIFLDCEYNDYGECDVEFMKREISFVNYVRDRKEAQVHIMITRQNAGNGGKKYDILFLGQKKFKNQNDTLSFVSLADNTEDEIREKQLKYLKLGLMKYVSHTKLAELLEISYSKPNNNKEEEVKDKWNSWVFKLHLNSWLRGESSKSEFYLWSNISAEKVTQKSKIIFSGGNSYSQQKYIFSNYDTTFINKSNYGSFLYVKSINDHWSIGGKVNGGSSIFNNYDFYANIYPAIEYNIYPYSKSSVKQLTMRLGAGYKYADYIDTTVYIKTTEHLALSKLAVAYKISKKWGSINTSIIGTSFLHDISKYDIEVNTDLNIRIIKGLSISISGGGSLIRDQINLRKRDASYEDVILKQKQIATDYRFWMSAGLSYTFGSIYNNVVNPRFGE